MLQKEIELWYDWFVAKPGIPLEQCICWVVTEASAFGLQGSPKLPGIVKESLSTAASGSGGAANDGGDAVKKAFDRFVGRVMSRTLR